MPVQNNTATPKTQLPPELATRVGCNSGHGQGQGVTPKGAADRRTGDKARDRALAGFHINFDLT
jgi:hypothetical protein